MLKNNQQLNTFMQSWFAALLLVVVMLASFGVVSLDNHHQAVNEVVAEAADIDEETELLSDDLPVSQVSLNIELLDLTLTRYVANQIAADHSAHKYDLSPRAPPHFI